MFTNELLSQIVLGYRRYFLSSHLDVLSFVFDLSIRFSRSQTYYSLPFVKRRHFAHFRSQNDLVLFTHSFSLFLTASGDGEIRTLDPLLARQVLSQLSYTPTGAGAHLSSQTVSSLVFSAARVLTIVFEMGTGVTPGRIDTSNGLKWTRTTDLTLIRRAL